MVLIILSSLLLTAYAILMLLYRKGWYTYSGNNTIAPSQDQLPKISVLIPARNEEENIYKCIQSIICNKYPAALLEVILIDDFSTDKTAELAEGLLQNGRGTVLRLHDYLSSEERINSFKKKALEIAIGEASGDWIVTTDADCKVPEYWLSHLATAMQQKEVQFIAAPVTFVPFSKKNLLYYFQSLDFMTMQGITAAGMQMNMGNMCNGATLAFRQAAFYEVEG